jgi:acetylornithine deacetylase/succinyl-diaminopimelate desuccinylase-like protein
MEERPTVHSWGEIAATVDDEVKQGLTHLIAAIRIPSVVAWGGDHLQRSAHFLATLLAKDGWSVEHVRVGENQAVLAEIGEPSAVKRIILYGHHDVQPPEPLDAWTHPPFEPIVHDGRIWGRGAGDNKGQFFTHIFAVRALKRLIGGIPVRLQFFLDGEEEAGNPSLKETLDFLRDRLAGAAFVYTVDGPEHPTGRPRVTFGFRGDLHLRLTVRTMKGNLHSGHWGNLAPDAAMLLCHALAACKDADGRVTIPGFADSIRPPDAHERTAIDAIPFDAAAAAQAIGARRLAGPDEVAPMERMMFRPTFTVTGLQSGYTGKNFQNAIASAAVAHIDIRYVPDQDPRHIADCVERHIRSIAPDSTIEIASSMDPSRTSMATPYAAAVSRALERGFGAPPLLLPSSGGSAPDALFTRELGLPSLWAHIANADMRGHAPDENICIDRISAGARATVALILDLAGVQVKQQEGGKNAQNP